MLGLMRELHRREHRVECVVSGWNDGDFVSRLATAEIPSHVAKLGWVFVRRPAWTLDSAVHYPGARRRVAGVLRALRPHCTIHTSHRTVLSLPGLLSASQTALHVVETWPDNRRTRLRCRALSPRVERVFANSAFIQERCVRLGMPRAQLRVSFPPVEKPEQVHSTELRPGADLRVGIVGQLIPRKGHLDLVRAVAALAERGVRAELHVFGRGEQPFLDGLRREAEGLRVSVGVPRLRGRQGRHLFWTRPGGRSDSG